MKMLNSVMIQKTIEDFGFASVDLLCIDLFSGKTCFYKFGAAPSYIKCGKIIKKVTSNSLSAGLYMGTGSEPHIVKMNLRPGCIAIIISDGVLAESGDKWLRELVCNFNGIDIKELAKETLQEAMRRCGCIDDMTILALHVDARG